MKYSAPLGNSLPYEAPPGAARTKEDKVAYYKALAQSRMRVMDQLFAYHQCEKGDWKSLAIQLAFAHVPAMLMRGRPGAPTKWTPQIRAELAVEIDDRRERAKPKRLSIASAAGICAKESRWKELLGTSRNPGDALRHQYQMADPDEMRALRDARTQEVSEPRSN